MANDQLAYIRGIHGVNVNSIEIHEKDFKDKVSVFYYYYILFKYICCIHILHYTVYKYPFYRLLKMLDVFMSMKWKLLVNTENFFFLISII